MCQLYVVVDSECPSSIQHIFFSKELAEKYVYNSFISYNILEMESADGDFHDIFLHYPDFCLFTLSYTKKVHLSDLEKNYEPTLSLSIHTYNTYFREPKTFIDFHKSPFGKEHLLHRFDFSIPISSDEQKQQEIFNFWKEKGNALFSAFFQYIKKPEEKDEVYHSIKEQIIQFAEQISCEQ